MKNNNLCYERAKLMSGSFFNYITVFPQYKSSQFITEIIFLLQSQDLRISQANEPCIGLTQENSMEFLVQCIYLYILTIDGLFLVIYSLP